MDLRLSFMASVGSWSRGSRPFFSAIAALCTVGIAAGCGGSGLPATSCEEGGCGAVGGGGGVNVGGSTGNVGGSGTSSGGGNVGGSGGAAPCDPTMVACPCDDAGACAGDKACVGGLCIDGCTFSFECGPAKACVDGACVAACNAVNPCDPGFTCDAGACVLDPEHPACDDMTPCLGGYICVGGICTTGCNTNLDCNEGQVCSGATHACIPDPSPKPLCDASRPCPVPQLCGVDGYCHYPCATVGECKLVDNRFIACDESVCKTEQEISPECTLDNPCPPGQSCISNKCQ